MRDFSDDLKSLKARLGEARGYMKIDDARTRAIELTEIASDPNLWDDQDRARSVNSELASLNDDIALHDDLAQKIDDVETLDQLAREMADESQEAEIEGEIRGLERRFDDLELRALFAGEWDERDAIVIVNSGEGGVDAQDWAEMLVRMYQRWAERHGFGFELDEASPGTEAGLSSATFIVKGRHAYGWLRSEQGVHRLVRMSPFDSAHRRQTSFASLDVTPLIEDTGEVQIEEKDLRIDTYRSSGAGGQHVNVTDSAVRITHIPTNIVVSCQNERSQTQNKARAMQVLVSKLAEVQRQQRRDEIRDISGTSAQASMGNQIRDYVMAPYQQVKDKRTNHEVGNIQGVLDGDLDELMAAFLRWERAHQ